MLSASVDSSCLFNYSKQNSFSSGFFSFSGSSSKCVSHISMTCPLNLSTNCYWNMIYVPLVSKQRRKTIFGPDFVFGRVLYHTTSFVEPKKKTVIRQFVDS